MGDWAMRFKRNARMMRSKVMNYGILTRTANSARKLWAFIAKGWQNDCPYRSRHIRSACDYRRANRAAGLQKVGR